MATASEHARLRHHPATEAGLWLVWIVARATGVAVLVHRARRAGPVVRGLARVQAHIHRAYLRAELAAAELLIGPAPDLLDLAATRLRRRAAWLTLAGCFLLNVAFLAAR